MQHKLILGAVAAGSLLLGVLLAALLLRPNQPAQSLTAVPARTAAGPAAVLPCGHPLGRFDKDAGAMQTGQAYCIHGHSYTWIHQQWKAGFGAGLLGPEWSPGVPNPPTMQENEERQRQMLEEWRKATEAPPTGSVPTR